MCSLYFLQLLLAVLTHAQGSTNIKSDKMLEVGILLAFLDTANAKEQKHNQNAQIIIQAKVLQVLWTKECQIHINQYTVKQQVQVIIGDQFPKKVA